MSFLGDIASVFRGPVCPLKYRTYSLRRMSWYRSAYQLRSLECKGGCKVAAQKQVACVYLGCMCKVAHTQN